jgi:hypothetical protein
LLGPRAGRALLGHTRLCLCAVTLPPSAPATQTVLKNELKEHIDLSAWCVCTSGVCVAHPRPAPLYAGRSCVEVGAPDGGRRPPCLPSHRRPLDLEDVAVLVTVIETLGLQPITTRDVALRLTGGPVPESSLRVRRITLRGCKSVDDSLVKALVKKVKRLRELDLRGCPVTAASVTTIAKNCLYLEALWLPTRCLPLLTLPSLTRAPLKKKKKKDVGNCIVLPRCHVCMCGVRLAATRSPPTA